MSGVSGLQLLQPRADVKVYNLTAGRQLPPWLSAAGRRRTLKSDRELQRRVELIHDFAMPTAASAIAVSPDARYVMATGMLRSGGGGGRGESAGRVVFLCVEHVLTFINKPYV